MLKQCHQSPDNSSEREPRTLTMSSSNTSLDQAHFGSSVLLEPHVDSATIKGTSYTCGSAISILSELLAM